ncbi:CRIB domain-containing protein RIC6-like [Nicotiana tomentosiformis]|uniref:CRIB domain-containing protein RIC6-like n=1 Tax=Nicotiana tabacum TaxID=4097 RepID=A0A1S4B0X8_TOBAC|nr:CRIB domain-containing protein RIC6-like [Nicotiana tomentosiformis]XP_016482499.1 PREDICTED: CRIB domain-containing protein RIC6-like [Nicotiana tabacum]
MTTKVKGLLKGLRYISQVFDEDKEKEMQIGFPTDVKHVAHIGWDGPSVDNPSWMKEFKSPGAFQSAPLVPPPGDLKENPDIKWVSEDSNRRSRNANSSSPTKDIIPEKPRTSRRHSTTENGTHDSTNKEPGTKSRSSRRHHNKETTSDGHKSSESSAKNHPDIPKKSRRKKSKEDGSASGSTRPSRSKGTSSSTAQTTDSGPGQEKESSGISKEKQEE